MSGGASPPIRLALKDLGPEHGNARRMKWVNVHLACSTCMYLHNVSTHAHLLVFDHAVGLDRAGQQATAAPPRHVRNPKLGAASIASIGIGVRDQGESNPTRKLLQVRRACRMAVLLSH